MLCPNLPRAFLISWCVVISLPICCVPTVLVVIVSQFNEIVVSQGSTLDTRSIDNSEENSLTLLQENNITQQELSLAHVINKALAMKLDISPTTQTNRDLLNCLHFLQYAIDHQQEGTDFVHLYSEFSNSDLYLEPLPPRKSSFEMFMNSIQTTPSATSNPQIPKPANSKTERVMSFPSAIEVIDIPRAILPSSSSLLCIHSNFVTRFDSVPSGERAIQSQIRALLGAVHCSLDLVIIQRCILLHQSWDE